MKYTVLLLRPDYIASEFGKDTFLEFVEANDPKHAVSLARDEAKTADGWDPGDESWADPEDYHVLLICGGWVTDISHLAE
jgi:hypothetical protein